MTRDDSPQRPPGGPEPDPPAGPGEAAAGDAVLAAIAHRLRARSERQQLLTERLRSGELRPGALADLAELAAAARRGARDGDHIRVLAGEPPRGPRLAAPPTPLGQLLSTVVAASETASRTVVPPTPSVSLDVAVESVLTQILAELLAHAGSVAPPGERIELHTRWGPDGGIVLEIQCAQPPRQHTPLDELDRALSTGRPAGPVAPQEIGLHVAARLARAIGARLGVRGPAGSSGLTPIAVLNLPATVIGGGARTEPPAAPSTAAPPAAAASAVAPSTADDGDGTAGLARPGDRQEGTDTPWPPPSETRREPAPATEQVPTWPPAAGGSRSGVAPAADPGSAPGDRGGLNLPPRNGQRPPWAADPGVAPAPNGIAPNGAPAYGAAPSSAASSSAASNSAASSSAASNSADPNGALPHGAGPNGTAPGGTGPPGAPGPQGGLPQRARPGAGAGANGAGPPLGPDSGPDDLPVTEALPAAGSTPPATLFGPFDSEVPVPIDDLDNTPIFASVASAWFREPSGSETTALPVTGNGTTPQPDNWRTPGDAEFDAARIRAERVVDLPTTAQGLPQRRPGQAMVPPSWRDTLNGADPSGSRERQPDRVRTRLASYQRGLREGRHRAAEDHTPAAGGEHVNGSVNGHGGHGEGPGSYGRNAV
ncbi:hypothetical protein ACLFMI_00320 [Pseudonocardia nantongensis]|uniref:hypothetical protein n=1 Tax=Pseudonocardia nantongensis TaxID=1181885 RepID=UPI003978182D